MIPLPPPSTKGTVSFEEAVLRRRTVRAFRSTPLELGQLSQLLWATYGVIDPAQGRKAIPSAGALYPIEIYLVVGSASVEGLGEGVYRYRSEGHALDLTASGDRRRRIAEASLWQMWMAEAPVTFAICAEYHRTTVKYRERGVRYVLMEVGHAAEHLFLQSVAIGLGAGIVGAFYDEEVKAILELPKEQEPLLLMPVGFPK